jgi:adenylate cyclase
MNALSIRDLESPVEQQHTQRKLTTILAADVEGYTRLMRADEEATLETLTEYRDVVDGLIARHDGRVFSTGGDSVLAEFGSAVEAVRCAISCQEEIASRNAELADDRKLLFRIGINVGDVMVRDDDLFGDGINVAARLEGLAEPGGVCISGSVFEQIKHKLSLGFEDMGQQEVKNITEPVSAYRLVPGQVSVAATTTAKASRVRHWRMPTIAAAVVVIIAAAGLVWWQPWAPDFEPASLERMAFPLPDRPSIAVLPFANLSGDSSQELFSDGITNDIITDLSRFGDLMVIASNSTFSYKGKPTKVQQVAEELGVRYVLEGSIQRIGEQVRVNVQFVDAISGEHLWAERYDRELRDIFAVQDEITQKVVAMLGAYEGRVAEADRARAKRKETTNLNAYELALLATEARHRFNKEDNAKSLELSERAVALDPQYARAYVELAWSHFQDAMHGYSESSEISTKMAYDSAKAAIEIDESFAEGHWALADILGYLMGQPEKAVGAYKQALALNPNHADILADWGGWYLPYLGRAEEGIAVVKKAMRLSPFHADWMKWALTNAYFTAGRYEEAISAFQSVEYSPVGPRLVLVASYAHAGKLEEARAEAGKILEMQPDFSIRAMSLKDRWTQAEVEHIRDGLRKAGLPE